METLVLACIAFLATHFVSSTPLRTVAVDAIGEKAWLGVYTVIAFATIGWMVWAYNRAPVEPLWSGLRLAPALLMPFAFMLLVGGLLTRNPTAVGQSKALKADDPARGGPSRISSRAASSSPRCSSARSWCWPAWGPRSSTRARRRIWARTGCASWA